MKLTLKRTAKKDTYTIGKLFVNDAYFCDTLEDKDRGLTQSMSLSEIRKLKVQDETAIPTGTYKVTVTVSPRFGRLLPRLNDVPGFDGILIHRGNTDKDTSGCILVGENKVVGGLINSTLHESKLVELLKSEKDIVIEVE